MREQIYSVYLVERGDHGGKREVTSPVRGNELEFYDTGVWLSRETGRNFFPYEQIRTIREHPPGYEPGGAGEAGESESTGTDPGEPTETELGVEESTGAEEEMLEE